MVEALKKIKRTVTGRKSQDGPERFIINDSVNLSASLDSRFTAAQQSDMISSTESEFQSRAQSIALAEEEEEKKAIQ